MTFDSSSKLTAEYTVAATATTPAYTLTTGIKVEPTQKYYTYSGTEKTEDGNYVGAINTQGEKKGIKISLKAGDKVKVYFAASGNNNDRYAVLYTVNGTEITAAVNGTVVADKGQGAVVVDTLVVPTDGTYIIGTNNGLRIAKVEITTK